MAAKRLASHQRPITTIEPMNTGDVPAPSSAWPSTKAQKLWP